MGIGHKRNRAISERTILQLKVSGPGVRRGRIPVPDLIRICEELQNTVNRQAEAMQGKKTMHPGPINSAIQKECTLELVSIKRGSTRLQFGLARPQEPLIFPDQTTFGAEVVAELALTIRSLGNGNSLREIDAGVLQALYGLGGLTESRRISEMDWIAPKTNGRNRIVAPVNKRVREHVAARLSTPRRAKMHVDGVLDMADFKPRDQKCRIDPAIGVSVMCSFQEKHASQVQSLLRRPVRATGEAILKPYSERIEVLNIHEIEPLPSLALGAGNFFAGSSLAELAAAQNVKPLNDISVLAGGFPEDVDIDKFLEDIYSSRK